MCLDIAMACAQCIIHWVPTTNIQAQYIVLAAILVSQCTLSIKPAPDAEGCPGPLRNLYK